MSEKNQTESPAGLREPEPERLSERELRSRQRAHRLPWLQIVILATALVALLVFYQSISEGVAGCYGRYIPEQTEAPHKEAAPLAPGEVPLTIEPAKPLPSK